MSAQEPQLISDPSGPAPGLLESKRRGGSGRPGFVWFVGAGPGDADLITLRGWRVLQKAEIVLHDSLVDPALFEDLGAECVFVGKRCGEHSMSQEQIIELLIGLALQGKRVVRLKGGDPAVLGRLGEEALSVADAGIGFEVVPGVTSSTSVPELAGIPVTHRSLADSFVVASAHRCAEGAELSIPPYLARTTLVLMMARATATEWQQQLLREGYPPELPVALISRGATEQQRVVVTSVASAATDLQAAGLETPVLAVVGRVVSLRAHLASRPIDSAEERIHCQ
ncbi:MAG: uroporphyrinogen-III C-methyltransferase [Deltaproteobacteria bacterium]|nr:uroporphyrinogen-III C-methyltransferase [Deltaproteobacteria bacterium]